jgi:hypothetical protein
MAEEAREFDVSGYDVAAEREKLVQRLEEILPDHAVVTTKEGLGKGPTKGDLIRMARNQGLD